MRAFWLLASSLLLGGCVKQEVVVAAVDRLLFQKVGVTVFGNPGLLTMKEIHLDGVGLRGKEVVIEGKVVEVSEHFTYMVITDDQARMLVVLTGIASAGPTLRQSTPRSVRVLGVIESGQKGLPYVMARSLNVVQNPGKA
jgi:hypothetical protein